MASLALDRIKNDPVKNDPIDLAKNLVESVSLHALLNQATDLREENAGIHVAAHTTLTISADDTGLTIFASPPIDIHKGHFSQTLHVASLHYDFASASFRSEVDVALDIGGAYAHAAQRRLDAALNEKLKPLLPAAMGRPGYDPRKDPNLADTIADARARLSSGTGLPAGVLSDVGATSILSARRELVIPLGLDDLQLCILPSKSIGITLATTGDASHPQLERLSLLGNGGIVVQKGTGATIASLFVRRIDMLHDGTIDYEYELGPEHLLSLFHTLGREAGAHLAERGGETPVAAPHLDSARRLIDATLKREVGPRLKAYLAETDQRVAGVSLRDLLAHT